MVWDWRALGKFRFLQYIEIDTKPENGCEIQNAADGVSGIIMQLKLVKTISEEYIIFFEEHDGLLHGTQVMIDRYRRYFISNISSLKYGMPYARERLRQVDDIPNADTVCVDFEINQPRVAERYYSRKLKIDESNRTRQDDFQL